MQFDFALGETAEMIRETTAPLRRPTGSRRWPREIDAEDRFPRELWPEMGELGLHGITVEEEDGGLGLGYLEHVIAMEEVSRASASIGLQLRRALQSVRQPDPPLGQRPSRRRNICPS